MTPEVAHELVRTSHGQPRACAHFKTCRWPAPAARTSTRPRATVLPRPLGDLQVAALSRVRTSPRPTGSSARRPLEDIQVAALSRSRARRFVKRAVRVALLAQKLKDSQMATLSRVARRLLVPRAAVLARVLQVAKWPPLAACSHTCLFKARFNTHVGMSRWPPAAAPFNRSSHIQPCLRAHSSIATCPPLAMKTQLRVLQPRPSQTPAAAGCPRQLREQPVVRLDHAFSAAHRPPRA